MKTFAVIGMGRFGQAMAKRLYSLGNEVLAIDESEAAIRMVADHVTYAVAGDAKNIEVLRNLGVGDYDAAVVAVGSDLSSSILITMNLKELGLKNVICKAANDRYEAALLKVGADRVIIPERTMGMKLAETLSSGNVMDFITLSDDYSIVELEAPKAWVGKSINSLAVRNRYGIALLAVRREMKMKISPGADFVFQSGDVVLALGENDVFEKLKAL